MGLVVTGFFLDGFFIRIFNVSFSEVDSGLDIRPFLRNGGRHIILFISLEIVVTITFLNFLPLSGPSWPSRGSRRFLQSVFSLFERSLRSDYPLAPIPGDWKMGCACRCFLS